MVFLSCTLFREWCNCSRVSCFRIVYVIKYSQVRAGRVKGICLTEQNNHNNSIGACKIHSTITNCSKSKCSSPYKQVLPIAEGHHKSNPKEMFLLRAYRTVMDTLLPSAQTLSWTGQSRSPPATSGFHRRTCNHLTLRTFYSHLLHKGTWTTACF